MPNTKGFVLAVVAGAGSLIALAAQIKPEEAGSNLAAWYGLIVGTVSDISTPAWLASPAADNWGTALGIGLFLSACLIWWRTRRRRIERQQASLASATEKDSCKSPIEIAVADEVSPNIIPDPRGRRYSFELRRIRISNLVDFSIHKVTIAIVEIVNTPTFLPVALPLSDTGDTIFTIHPGEIKFVDMVNLDVTAHGDDLLVFGRGELKRPASWYKVKICAFGDDILPAMYAFRVGVAVVPHIDGVDPKRIVGRLFLGQWTEKRGL